MKCLFGLLAAVPLVLATTTAFAQDERSYTEGPVSEVTAIKIQPGGFDAYMSWLATSWKSANEEYKKAGIIVDYAVYGTNARTPKDPDLYLIITYKNWGALDGIEDRTQAIDKKIFGSRDQANQQYVDREKIRQVLGVEYVQRLNLK